MALTVSPDPSGTTLVSGRGELQLGILVEQMRREGYEFCVFPPRVVGRTCDVTGKNLEPFEEVVVDAEGRHAGTIVDMATGPGRRGVLVEMREMEGSEHHTGMVRLVLEIPTRGLLGFGPEVASATGGTAAVNRTFLEDREWVGNLAGASSGSRGRGRLVSNDLGKATLYALSAAAERGRLFVEPGDEVYPGMVVGERSKGGDDLEVNPLKAKKTSNVRTVNKDDKLSVPPAKKMSVEELVGYMNDDEVIEVTPGCVRLRKAELDAGARERAARSRKKREDAARLASKGKR